MVLSADVPEDATPRVVRHGLGLVDQPSSSLADRAYRELSERILTLEIPPGAPIPEERLCAQLELGRTPIREALKRLEAERLVVVHPRRGTFASEVPMADHVLIADVRRPLEALAARRAAERASAAERQRLLELREGLARPGGDTDVLVAMDAQIHRSVARATHNHHLAVTLQQYYNLSLRIWYLFIDQLGPMDEHVASHVPMVDAVVDGDADRAAALAAAHVVEFEQAVARAVELPASGAFELPA